MPDRSVIGQLTQISPETTEGTQVAASKQLKSIDMNLGGHGEATSYRPVGGKYNTIVAPMREWSVLPITGQPVYDEISYIFAGIIGTSVDTTTGTTGQQHVYTLNPAAADTIKTYSLEKGGSVGAQSAAGALITDFSMPITRTSVAITGNGMARRLNASATLTASPTTVPQVPILATQADIFVDPTRAGLGTTQLTRVFGATVTLGTRFGGVWPLNSSLTSYAAHIETVPAATVSITMEADTAGLAYLTNFRAGSTVYVRVRFTGPQIGAGPATYLLQYDMPLKITAFNEFSDQNGVYSIVWPTVMVDDGTSPLIVTLVNATAAL